MEEKRSVLSLVKASNTITSSIANLRFVAVAALVGAFLTAAVCVGYTIYSFSESGKKIYVLDKGQVLTASRQDVRITRGDEVEAQSERFHTLFFTGTPNREVMNRNINEALELCGDRSVYDYYNDIDESGFYRRLSQNNAIQEIIVDSVRYDIKSYPYRVVTFSTLYLTRTSVITKNLLITRMNMIDVPRNERNLNGLKIEEFEVLRNDEIDRRKR